MDQHLEREVIALCSRVENMEKQVRNTSLRFTGDSSELATLADLERVQRQFETFAQEFNKLARLVARYASAVEELSLT